MQINNVSNQNNASFGAKLRIVQSKTFQKPSEYFDEWLAENLPNWEWKARCIGSDKDRITLILGKNGIKQGDIFLKQNMTAESKINGIKIKSNDLKFEYTKIGDRVDRYFYNLQERVDDYFAFIKRLANSKISK